MDKKFIFLSALFSLSFTGLACNNAEPPPAETPQTTAPTEAASSPPAVFTDLDKGSTSPATTAKTPSLIPATSPNQQQKIIAQGKTPNLFNLVPDPKRNILIEPNPDYVPPEVKKAEANAAAMAASGATTNANTPGGGGGGTTGANKPNGVNGAGTSSTSGISLPGAPNIRTGATIKPKPFFVPVLPTLPEPKLAKQILVSGVVKIGNKANLIVETPQEGGKNLVQYVKEGDYLGNGQVLVKRIDTNRYTPLIVFEQYGIEVPKVVGVSSQQVTAAAAPTAGGNPPPNTTLNNVGTILEPQTPLGGVPTNNPAPAATSSDSVPRELTDREIRERSRENLLERIRNNSLIQ